MTAAPASVQGEGTIGGPAPYPLILEADDRSWTARENLTDVVERELLGPLNGPDELLATSPDVAYLVGRIAPYRLTEDQGDPVNTDDADPPTDVGDATDADGSRGVPVSAVDEEGAGDAEEDQPEDRPQQRGLMIPASMGLRFQLPRDADTLTVTASWGVYHPERDPEEDERSRNRRYRRRSVEKPQKIAIKDLTPGETAKYPLHDEVVLRVDRHDDVERGCRIIEVALCNDRVTPRAIPVDAWLYQTKLHVEAGGAAVFLPVNDALLDTGLVAGEETTRLALQYRDRLEFAVGRTCSVDWHQTDGRRADAVWTTWLPIVEIPQTSAEEVSAALVDMAALADADVETLRSRLTPIVVAYREWLDLQEQRVVDLPEHLREEAQEALEDARAVQHQLAAGLEHLLAEEEALRCFAFMNSVMAEQRLQTQVAEHRARRPKVSIAAARAAVLAERGAKAHSWRTFQLAFILMQLPLLTDPAAAKRSGPLATAQLLFFPTGGGKTEAYLGLAAYTFAIRRRHGVVGPPDEPLDGYAGVNVLMRYTLRLLTAQQFQRATALVCAAELERSRHPETWGREPFRIGLWVGTDVSPKRYHEAAEQLEKVSAGNRHRLTVLQVQRCPWCGHSVGARDVKGDPVARRIHVYCGDDRGQCPFAEGGAADEGLPVLTTDEEIYRLAPAFVIATVDKFARLAREGEAASLFGYVAKRCERHGFVHPDYKNCDIKDGNKHPAKNGHSAAAVHPVIRLRPPDLIIQDELHLITGALGTTVGLFEVAVDTLSSWRDNNGAPVRPLLVASTATARNAPDQVKALYGRDTTIFPPQVLDAGHSFFAKEVPITPDTPGRRYLGLSTTGVRLTTAEIRVAEVLMAAGQLLLDRSGRAADPYLTLVGYFSAIRELAGMARYLGDDIRTNLAKGRAWSRLPRRRGTEFGDLHTAELTSRVSNANITETLDEMAIEFDPALDTTAARRDLAARRAAGEKVPTRTVNPYDAVLATSMLQVGVDVTRLGLMLVVGQPKNTAEYIQASSRVGRAADRPGLVVALGNWARPRDLAHFEQFRHYHETFYAEVEALSVTPFSTTSLERGLDAVLAATARVVQASRPEGLSPEKNAGRVDAQHAFLAGAVDTLVGRIGRAADEDSAERARLRLTNGLDQWSKRRSYAAGKHRSLVYERVTNVGQEDPLLISPENAKALADSTDMPPFVVPNSMREVQPEINLLVSPIEDNLYYREPPGAPQFDMPRAVDAP